MKKEITRPSRARKVDDQAVSLESLTDFQRKVCNLTEKIPAGKVSTYWSIAKILGNQGLARAVGNTLNKNPRPDKIPCHRVVRSDRMPGGYKWGTEKKKKLLRKEGVQFDKYGKIKERYLLTDWTCAFGT